MPSQQPDGDALRRRDLLRSGATAIAGTGLVTGLAGCSDMGGGDQPETTTVPPGTEVVAVGPEARFEFSPGTESPLTIPPDTRVRFVWESNTHNVHVRSQPDGANWKGHDPVRNEGFSFESRFTVPGTYEYVCEPHESLGMVGEIVVEDE